MPITMSVPVERYNDFVDYLVDMERLHYEAGNTATSVDYKLACGAILCLLQDMKILDCNPK